MFHEGMHACDTYLQDDEVVQEFAGQLNKKKYFAFPDFVAYNSKTFKLYMDIHTVFYTNPRLFDDLNKNFPPINCWTGKPFWDPNDSDVVVDTFQNFINAAGFPNKITLNEENNQFAFDFNDYPKGSDGKYNKLYPVWKSFKSSFGHYYEFDPYVVGVATLKEFVAFTNQVKGGSTTAIYNVLKIPQYVAYDKTTLEIIFNPLGSLPDVMYGDSWTLGNPPFKSGNSGDKLWDSTKINSYQRCSFKEYLQLLQTTQPRVLTKFNLEPLVQIGKIPKVGWTFDDVESFNDNQFLSGAKPTQGYKVISLKTWAWNILNIDIGEQHLRCSEFDRYQCPFPTKIPADKTSKLPLIPLEVFGHHPGIFEDLTVSNPPIDPKTSNPVWVKDSTNVEIVDIDVLATNFITKYASPDQDIRIFINLEKMGSLAFPLEDYPKQADGTLYSSFDMTYIHKCPYGIPYWDSPNQVGLLSLKKYTAFIKTLQAPNAQDQKKMPKIVPFVVVNPDNYQLYFDPLAAPTAFQDGKFTVTQGTSDTISGQNLWKSTDKIEKWCIKKWAQKLFTKQHYIALDYNFKPLWTLNKFPLTQSWNYDKPPTENILTNNVWPEQFIIVTLEAFFQHLGVMVHDCYFDSDIWFSQRFPLPSEVIFKNSDKTMVLTLDKDYPEHPNYFKNLDPTKPFKKFNWETRKMEDSWVPSEVSKLSLESYLNQYGGVMKNKILVNLVENRLAFPLTQYPQKPKSTGGFELDGAFTMDQMIYDEGEPCWDNPHQVAMVNFLKLVKFVEKSKNSGFIPYKATLKSNYVAVNPINYKLVIPPLNPPAAFQNDDWTEVQALTEGQKSDSTLKKVIKMRFEVYIQIISYWQPYVATDFTFHNHWDFFTQDVHLIWSFDNLPTVPGINWAEQDVMVLTLKAWCKFVLDVQIDLEQDFDEDWFQLLQGRNDFYPFPAQIPLQVTNSNSKTTYLEVMDIFYHYNRRSFSYFKYIGTSLTYIPKNPMNNQPFWSGANNIQVKSFKDYINSLNLPDKITFNIWQEKFAFPIKDYPKKADGTFNEKYKITKVVRDQFDIDYWQSIYEIALINLNVFVKYIENQRAETNSSPLKSYNQYYAPSFIAPYVAWNFATHKLCFDPLLFYDTTSDSTKTKTEKYIKSSWTLEQVATDYSTVCSNTKELMKLSLRNFVEMIAEYTPFIATKFNYEPYWKFHDPPKDNNNKLIRWDFDNIKTKVTSVQWNADSQIMVMTLKAWIVKVGIITDLDLDDGFDGNIHYCQDLCPLPNEVVYKNNDKSLVTQLKYYYIYPETFEDFNINFPFYDKYLQKDLWVKGDTSLTVSTFTQYLEALGIQTKFKMVYNIFEDKLAFPLELYPKTTVPQPTFDQSKISFDMTPLSENGQPLWKNKYEIALLNLKEFSQFIDTCRSWSTVHQQFHPSGVIAKYVAYNPTTLKTYFDPFNTPLALQDYSAWNEKAPFGSYWNQDTVNANNVAKSTLGHYFELLEQKMPYIATDFNLSPLWYIFDPPQANTWSFDTVIPQNNIPTTPDTTTWVSSTTWTDKSSWPSQFVILHLRTWVIKCKLSNLDLPKLNMYPKKMVWNKVTKKILTPPSMIMIHPELFQDLSIVKPVTLEDMKLWDENDDNVDLIRMQDYFDLLPDVIPVNLIGEHFEWDLFDFPMKNGAFLTSADWTLDAPPKDSTGKVFWNKASDKMGVALLKPHLNQMLGTKTVPFDLLEDYQLKLKSTKFAYNPTTKVFYWDPLNPPPSALQTWDKTTSIPTNPNNNNQPFWTNQDGNDQTKVKIITLEDFILDTDNLFPNYIAVKVNGEPYWSPFNPPKSNGAYIDYPNGYSLINIPKKTGTSDAYWTADDFVMILSVKRFFDMNQLYNSYLDNEVYDQKYVNNFYEFAEKMESIKWQTQMMFMDHIIKKLEKQGFLKDMDLNEAESQEEQEEEEQEESEESEEEEEEEEEEEDLLKMAMDSERNNNQMRKMDDDMLSEEDFEHMVEIVDILRFAGLEGVAQMIEWIQYSKEQRMLEDGETPPMICEESEEEDNEEEEEDNEEEEEDEELDPQTYMKMVLVKDYTFMFKQSKAQFMMKLQTAFDLVWEMMLSEGKVNWEDINGIDIPTPPMIKYFLTSVKIEMWDQLNMLEKVKYIFKMKQQMMIMHLYDYIKENLQSKIDARMMGEEEEEEEYFDRKEQVDELINMSDEELWWSIAITQLQEMAYLEIIHKKKVHPLMSHAERPPLPNILVQNKQTKSLYLPPNFVEMNPYFFDNINLEDPPVLQGIPLWTLEDVSGNNVEKISLDDYVAQLPTSIPFNMETQKTVWSLFDYMRTPSQEAFLTNWKISTPLKVFEENLWTDTGADGKIFVFKTSTYLKMWRGDFDGLDYLCYREAGYGVKVAYNPKNNNYAYFNPFQVDANGQFTEWSIDNPPRNLWTSQDVTNGKVAVDSIEDYIKKLPVYYAIKPDLSGYWDFFTVKPSGNFQEEWSIDTPPNNYWTENDDVIVLPLKRYLQLLGVIEWEAPEEESITQSLDEVVNPVILEDYADYTFSWSLDSYVYNGADGLEFPCVIWDEYIDVMKSGEGIPKEGFQCNMLNYYLEIQDEDYLLDEESQDLKDYFANTDKFWDDYYKSLEPEESELSEEEQQEWFQSTSDQLNKPNLTAIYMNETIIQELQNFAKEMMSSHHDQKMKHMCISKETQMRNDILKKFMKRMHQALMMNQVWNDINMYDDWIKWHQDYLSQNDPTMTPRDKPYVEKRIEQFNDIKTKLTSLLNQMKEVAAILTDEGLIKRFTKEYQDLTSQPLVNNQETEFRFERELIKIWVDQTGSKTKAQLETKLFANLDKTQKALKIPKENLEPGYIYYLKLDVKKKSTSTNEKSFWSSPTLLKIDVSAGPFIYKPIPNFETKFTVKNLQGESDNFQSGDTLTFTWDFSDSASTALFGANPSFTFRLYRDGNSYFKEQKIQKKGQQEQKLGLFYGLDYGFASISIINYDSNIIYYSTISRKMTGKSCYKQNEQINPVDIIDVEEGEELSDDDAKLLLNTFQKNDAEESDCGKDDKCSDNGTCDKSGIIAICKCKVKFYGSDCSQSEESFNKSQKILEKLTENLLQKASSLKPEEVSNFIGNLAIVASKSQSSELNAQISTFLEKELDKPINDPVVATNLIDAFISIAKSEISLDSSKQKTKSAEIVEAFEKVKGNLIELVGKNQGPISIDSADVKMRINLLKGKTVRLLAESDLVIETPKPNGVTAPSKATITSRMSLLGTFSIVSVLGPVFNGQIDQNDKLVSPFTEISLKLNDGKEEVPFGNEKVILDIGYFIGKTFTSTSELPALYRVGATNLLENDGITYISQSEDKLTFRFSVNKAGKYALGLNVVIPEIPEKQEQTKSTPQSTKEESSNGLVILTFLLPIILMVN